MHVLDDLIQAMNHPEIFSISMRTNSSQGGKCVDYMSKAAYGGPCLNISAAFVAPGLRPLKGYILQDRYMSISTWN